MLFMPSIATRTLFAVLLLVIAAEATLRGRLTEDAFFLEELESGLVANNADGHRVLQTAKVVGDNGDPDSSFPLGECEGDCDTDDDCEDDLVCYQRSKGSSVPGCSSSSSIRNSNSDFCAKPSSSGGGGGGGGSSSSSFYLKLYWEKGYYWQEESFERKWCLDCAGSGCGSGDSMIIVDCDDDSPTKLVFVFYGSEFQIRISGEDLCFELKSDRSINLASCSSSSSSQRFIGQNGNPSGSGRFELVPKNKRGFCLTQRHHPRRGETIQAETCDTARKSDTSYWNKR